MKDYKVKDRPTTLVYLGPEGSYSHIATEKAISLLNLSNYEIKSKNSVKNIIETVDKNNDFIGILPIENSIDGIIRETIDNIIKTNENLTVFQEIILPISFCLISKGHDINKIRNIVAVPPAYAQCYNYIEDKISKKYNIAIQIHKSTSNSEAVKTLSNLDETYAAIGNEKSAQLYGMNILLKDINDEKDNKTRFVCFGHKNTDRTGFDRTSIAFTTKNKSGALVDILQIFKEHDINLSYIESRPSKKILGDYTFFTDFDGHIQDENVKTALEKIKPMIDIYRFIGSYPRCNSVKQSE